MSRRRILIALFDGLRPDLVTEEFMPVLARFVAGSCVFPESRCVFPSSTRVNSTALGSGCHPGAHGVVANKYFDGRVFTDRLLHTGDLDHVQRAEKIYGSRFVTAPSLGDTLAANGLRFAVVASGSAGTARLVNPRAGENGQVTLCSRKWESSTPRTLADDLVTRFGAIPEIGFPSNQRMVLQTTMFLEGVFPDYRPDVSLVWFNEPDWTQHYRGLGSPEVNSALKCLDEQFARLLDWANSPASGGDVQIIAMSDHGHITARREIDVRGAMAEAGFETHAEAGPKAPLVASLGGAAAVWLRDSAAADRLSELVEWLIEQPWCGLVFSRGETGHEGGIRGTLNRNILMHEHARSPDLFFTLRGDDEVNGEGIPGGCFYATGDIPEGGSIHGGLHPREMNNLLALSGNAIGSGRTITNPAGITDVAPTVLALLGIPAPQQMTGRALNEAIRPDWQPAEEAVFRDITVVSGKRRQTLRRATFEGTTYILGGKVG